VPHPFEANIGQLQRPEHAPFHRVGLNGSDAYLIKAFTSLAITLKNSMTRIRRSPWAALVVVAFAVSPVLGKDLNVLVRVLYSAFVAEQGSSMCMVPSITLLQTERSVFIDAHNYAQLVKQKVTAGLSDHDVQFVLRSAAVRPKKMYS
jgi:hypothetical protein